MREIRTEIEIEAPAERVWALFTDFAAHARWDPYTPEWEGRAEVGAKMRIVANSGTPPRKMTFTPTVVEHEPGRRLRYRGSMGPSWVLGTDHLSEVVPLGAGRCRFVSAESFTGLLVPVLWGTLNRDARAGFEAMNRALKAEAERGPGAGR